MNKIKKVIDYLDNIIINSIDRKVAITHLYGVAHCCSLLAVKRELDSDLAFVCGLFHDIYTYKTGVGMLHGINGAEMVRVIFKYSLKDVFTTEEEMIIRSAIFHHSDKMHIHDEYDELLKDADLLQHWLFDTKSDEFVNDRLIEVQKELGLPITEIPIDLSEKIIKNNKFNRCQFADIAEEIAKKKIQGEKSNIEYMDIIKYYPETTAFEDLFRGWCAAFVYHCTIKAGLKIPIRYEPMVNTRFACVEAWLEWGKKNGFCFKEQDGFIPCRGDIIIFDNIIPSQNKPANCPWYDHIGVLLSIDEDELTVAEGNYNNDNISFISKRKRYENIGCYIRIPDDYEYDGWKYDYKTQKYRVKNY